MLHRVLVATISLWACSSLVAFANPNDDLQSALQKLADSPNYSWTTTVEGGFGRAPMNGKTQKDGLTWFSMQMRDNSVEMLIKGDKIAIKTDDGWKSASEIESADDGDQPSPGRFAVMMARNLQGPAAQSAEMVGKLQNVQATTDGFSADLSQNQAEQALTFRRRRPTTNPDQDSDAPQISVRNAKGTVAFTVKDGEVTKIVMHVTGTVTFNDNDRDVDRTTTTEIKDVGTTTIDIPADAKAKLGS